MRIEVLEAASGEERITMEIPNDSEVTYYRAITCYDGRIRARN